MPRLLNEQQFCGWCSTKTTYTSEWSSECSQCHYKNYLNPKPCTSVIITSGNKVLLVKRAIEPAKGQYDLPGGFMDMDDASLEACAYRELAEEMGFATESFDSLAYFDSGLNPYNWQDSEIVCLCAYFVAAIQDSSTAPTLDQTENSEYTWITEADLPNIDLAWDIDRKMLTKYFKENK